MGLNVVNIFLIVVCIYLFSTVSKLDARVIKLENKLKLISNSNDVTKNSIDDELRQLIKEGNDVKAVKRLRETKELSLLEAKQYIDNLKLEM